ncbi:MAG: hypothetical protein CMN29_20575 [Sandaracinus sp.]|nr:hypothetical protein [Sandaracinus sp.]
MRGGAAGWAVLCVALLALGCGDDDAGGVDGGGVDAGGGVDGGGVDAGGSVDAGGVDADGGADAGVDPEAAYFPPSVSWRQPVDEAPLDDESEAVIGWLEGADGWGNGNTFQIDFSIEVLPRAGAEPRAFTPTGDHYSPDCDTDPVPVPPGGRLEGEEGYACAGDGDCHLIVWDAAGETLWEMWRADIEGETFAGGCLAVWDTARDYGDVGRGLDCTSADAAGLPIAPLLFTADEVASGEIRHAIRFILPNGRIRNRVYVPPATHSTGATDGADDAPPYGARLRLRADYPVESLPSEGARVVARALQRYGMILADAGQIALTAQSDRLTTAKWEDLLGPRDLSDLEVGDFEMVRAGERRTFTGDCVRVD